MRNHSYENDFDLHENETACTTHFDIRGFVRGLVLKQRHKRTRKCVSEEIVVFRTSVFQLEYLINREPSYLRTICGF